MTPELFDQTLRERTVREPFRPFVVELKDGTRIQVRHPAVAFGGGAAGFIDEEGALVGFSWREVAQMLDTSDRV
jgi:hypothetical protein